MKTTRRKTAILAVLCVLLVSGLLFAGPGGPGRGRGGRGEPGFGLGPGGPGGPGIGMPRRPVRPGGPGARGRQGGPGRGMMLARMLYRLDLTEEQKEQVKEILEAAGDKSEAAREALADATKALHTATIEEADEAAIREAAAKLGKAIGDEAVLRTSTAASIKKVLTDEQREKLDQMKERVEKFREKIEKPGFRGRFGGGRMRGTALHRGRRPRGPGAGFSGPDRGPGRGYGVDPGGGRGRGPGGLSRGFGGPGRGPARGFGGPGRGPGVGPGARPGRGSRVGPGPGGGPGIDRLIDIVDTDGDGTLTAEELESFKEKMKDRPRR